MLLTELKDFKTKLEYHHKLNPALWDGDVLKKEVYDKFKEIVGTFIEDLELDKSKIKDIIFTGSNTNYNWTELSDIDLHVIMKDDGDMDAFEAKKTLWNDKHTIKIKGFAIEMYIETSATGHSKDQGLYSIKDNKWIREPSYQDIKFDYEKIKSKAKKWMIKIDKLVDGKSKDLKALEAIKEHLKTSRRKDVARGGEFSMENLVFKALRNNGYLAKLFDYIAKVKDEALSLK